MEEINDKEGMREDFRLAHAREISLINIAM